MLYQQQAIPSRQFPNVSYFQTQQESEVNQNTTFTSMLNDDSHQTQSCLVTYLRD